MIALIPIVASLLYDFQLQLRRVLKNIDVIHYLDLESRSTARNHNKTDYVAIVQGGLDEMSLLLWVEFYYYFVTRVKYINT